MSKNKSNKNNVYTDEIVNSIKIIRILIDIGTKALQKILNEVIKNENSKYASVKLNNTNYNSAREFIQSNRNKIETDENLFDDQKTLLNEGTYTKYDITLCCILFKHILIAPANGWNKMPHRDDKSLAANIVRLKSIRNTKYAHIHKLGSFPKEDLNRLVSQNYPNEINAKYPGRYILPSLEYIIYSFCKDKQEIDGYKTQIENSLNLEVNESTLDKYKDKISNLMSKDAEIYQIIFNKLEDFNIKEINENILQLRKDNKNKFDYVKAKQISTLKLLGKYNKDFKDILDDLDSIKDDLQEIKMGQNRTLEEIKLAKDCTIEEINKSSINVIETLQIVSDKFENSKKIEILNDISITLEDLKSYFDEEKLNFNILFFDSLGLNFKNFDYLQFINTIASFNWNVIIDLNIKKDFSKTICQNHKKNYILHSYTELDKQLDKIELVYSGEWLFYVTTLTDGDERNDEAIAEEIKNIFSKSGFGKHCLSKNFNCFNFLVNESYDSDTLEKLNEYNKSIKSCIYKINKNKAIKIVNLFFTDLENLNLELIKLHTGKITGLMEKKTLPTTTNQFLTKFKPIESKELERLLPGDDFDITWTSNDEKLYGAFVEPYHTNMGFIDVENYTADEKKKFFFKKKLSFLIGNEIDPETIYINDVLNEKTYYTTNIMIEKIKEIRQKSKKKEFFTNNVLVHKIFHNAYCGGTTFGRVVLFKNRQEFPCFRIKILEKNALFELFQKISKNSNKPLLLLIDNTDIKNIDLEEVIDFSQHLEIKATLRHFILYVQRSFDENAIIKNNFNDEEIKNYEKLYEEFLQNEIDHNDKKTIYVKNLLNFKLMKLKPEEKKELIKTKVKEILNPFNDKEKKLITLMNFNDKFLNGEFMRPEIFAFILKEDINDIHNFYDDSKKNKKLDLNVLNFIKINKDHGFKILDIDLSQEMVNLLYDKEQLKKFFELFLELIISFQDRDKGFNSDITDFTQRLLINNKTNLNRKEKIVINEQNDDLTEEIDDEYQEIPSKYDSEFDIKTKFFSPLIIQALNDEKLGIVNTEEYIKIIYKIFQDVEISPYLGQLYARFVFHINSEFEKKEQGIKILKMAFKLKMADKLNIKNLPENCKKTDLLCFYGDLYRHFTIIKIKKQSISMNKEETLYEILDTANESIKAYNESQNLDKLNDLALIGECKIRLHVLLYYFKIICNNDCQIFLKNIKNPDKKHDIINNSEIEIREKLEKLEKNGRDLDEYFYFECKIKLLDLRISSYTITNLKKLDMNIQIGLYHIKKVNESSNDFNPDDIIFLYNRYKKQLKELKSNFFSSSYRDMIKCLIILSNKNHNFIDEKKLKDALDLANLWKKFHGDEPDAYYYSGIFNFLIGIQKNNDENIYSAREDFIECKKIYNKRNPVPRKFRYLDYLIGEETGLKALKDYDKKTDYKYRTEKKIENLFGFEGELICGEKHNFVNYKGLKIKYLERNAFDEDSKLKEPEKNQKNNYKFFICIRRSDLLMYKFRRIQHIADVNAN